MQVLYEKEYFGFPESAVKYVEELMAEITESLPDKQLRNAPVFFDSYGKEMSYAVFAKSRHTVWYVFFTVHHNDDSTIFLVRHISNNHRIGKYL